MSVRKFSTASILSPSFKNSKLWDGTTTPGYFESIATIIVPSAGAANVTFSNIPNTYTNLQIRILTKTDRATYAHDDFGIKVGNGTLDSGNNYSCHKMQSEYVSGYNNVYSAGAANTTRSEEHTSELQSH